jgi:hypothetical protein
MGIFEEKDTNTLGSTTTKMGQFLSIKVILKKYLFFKTVLSNALLLQSKRFNIHKLFKKKIKSVHQPS